MPDWTLTNDRNTILFLPNIQDNDYLVNKHTLIVDLCCDLSMESMTQQESTKANNKI